MLRLSRHSCLHLSCIPNEGINGVELVPRAVVVDAIAGVSGRCPRQGLNAG